jgi:histidinol phosphatase-like enzyme
MDSILDILKNYESIIILVLVVLNVILIFSQILNKVELNRLEKKYKKLMKGSTGKNIEELVLDYNDKVDESLEAAKKIEALYQDVDERLKKCVQKVSVIRYRAFDDVGSDLSFSIAFLDDKNDGVVFTGIYGRNECTTFAKPIDNGISKYDLSDEEKLAVRNAINNK